MVRAVASGKIDALTLEDLAAAAAEPTALGYTPPDSSASSKSMHVEYVE